MREIQAFRMAPVILTSIANPLVGSALLFAQAKGGGMTQAISSGADLGTAEAFGNASALLEVAVEALSGGIAGLKPTKGLSGEVVKGFTEKEAQSLAKRFIGTKGGKWLVETLSGATGEGMEEVVSDVLTPLLAKATYDPNAEMPTLSQVKDTFLNSAAFSVFLSGASNFAKISRSTPSQVDAAVDALAKADVTGTNVSGIPSEPELTAADFGPVDTDETQTRNTRADTGKERAAVSTNESGIPSEPELTAADFGPVDEAETQARDTGTDSGKKRAVGDTVKVLNFNRAGTERNAQDGRQNGTASKRSGQAYNLSGLQQSQTGQPRAETYYFANDSAGRSRDNIRQSVSQLLSSNNPTSYEAGLTLRAQDVTAQRPTSVNPLQAEAAVANLPDAGGYIQTQAIGSVFPWKTPDGRIVWENPQATVEGAQKGSAGAEQGAQVGTSTSQGETTTGKKKKSILPRKEDESTEPVREILPRNRKGTSKTDLLQENETLSENEQTPFTSGDGEGIIDKKGTTLAKEGKRSGGATKIIHKDGRVEIIGDGEITEVIDKRPYLNPKNRPSHRKNCIWMSGLLRNQKAVE